jgi:hypothetical protein
MKGGNPLLFFERFMMDKKWLPKSTEQYILVKSMIKKGILHTEVIRNKFPDADNDTVVREVLKNLRNAERNKDEKNQG